MFRQIFPVVVGQLGVPSGGQVDAAQIGGRLRRVGNQRRPLPAAVQRQCRALHPAAGQLLNRPPGGVRLHQPGLPPAFAEEADAAVGVPSQFRVGSDGRNANYRADGVVGDGTGRLFRFEDVEEALPEAEAAGQGRGSGQQLTAVGRPG